MAAAVVVDDVVAAPVPARDVASMTAAMLRRRPCRPVVHDVEWSGRRAVGRSDRGFGGRAVGRRVALLGAAVVLDGHGAAGDRACGEHAGDRLHRARACACAGRQVCATAALGGGRAEDAREQRVGGHGAGRRAQRQPRAVEVLAGSALGHAERQGDLLVRAAFDLAQQQRVALRRGERLDGGERLAQAFAQLNDVSGLRGAGTILVQHLAIVLGRAQDVERGVVGDAVEPGLQCQLLL